MIPEAGRNLESRERGRKAASRPPRVAAGRGRDGKGRDPSQFPLLCFFLWRSLVMSVILGVLCKGKLPIGRHSVCQNKGLRLQKPFRNILILHIYIHTHTRPDSAFPTSRYPSTHSIEVWMDPGWEIPLYWHFLIYRVYVHFLCSFPFSFYVGNFWIIKFNIQLNRILWPF